MTLPRYTLAGWWAVVAATAMLIAATARGQTTAPSPIPLAVWRPHV